MNEYVLYALLGAACLVGLIQACRKLSSANGKLRSTLERQRQAVAASMYVTDYVLPALRFLREGKIQRSQHGTLLDDRGAISALSRTWAACPCKALSGLAFNCGAYFEMPDVVNVDRNAFLSEIEQRAVRLKNAADDFLFAAVTTGVAEAESEAAWLSFVQAMSGLEKENADFQDSYCLQRC
ncbi:MAG: hypothetical protein K2W82_17610 [Candidatus Obscuribacterales bacterium]|jgi:hypothetical protein|nr:hypothetical protein [Candidatus Obscuribacterales bacterium]